MKVKDAQFFCSCKFISECLSGKEPKLQSQYGKILRGCSESVFYFLEATESIPRQRVSWNHFTRQNIQDFVDWLEKVQELQ